MHIVFYFHQVKQEMTPPKKYDSNEIDSILETLFVEKASGILSLETKVDSWKSQRACILFLYNGNLVYGADNITQAPSNQELGHILGKGLRSDSINAALAVANKRLVNPTSYRELVELLVKLKAFTWKEVETLVTSKTAIILEKFRPNPGTCEWQETANFDLSYGADRHGLNWSYIQYVLKQRRQKWMSYEGHIPHMDAIPTISAEQLKLVDNPSVKNHLCKFINCKDSLVDIAEKMGKDPLVVAKNYFKWANSGWVNLVDSPITCEAEAIEDADDSMGSRGFSAMESEELPIVLSVDDSPIIQVSIKRALQEKYNVLLADRAVKALQILKQQPVKLMLLDLTMPDVDGLQFCKTVRQIPQFQNLPIIMVTARDGIVNKAKGHMAGTSKYLTKPFKPEELRQVVAQYISQK